jgi:hypothetical protein
MPCVPHQLGKHDASDHRRARKGWRRIPRRRTRRPAETVKGNKETSEMRKIFIATAAAATLASGGAGARPCFHVSIQDPPCPLTKEDETIAHEAEHNMNEFIMAGCETLSDIKGADFDRTARQRHVAVTLDDCIKASAALAAEFERKPK